MPNQSGKIVLVLVLLLIFSCAAVYFFSPSFKKQEYSKPTPNLSMQQSIVIKEASISSDLTKNYYSKFLKISFKVPEGAKVEERFTDILITLSDGIVQIRRTGTNFSNISEYLKNLIEVNKLKLLTVETKQINKYDAIMLTMQDPNFELKTLKEYLFYANNWVFKFSTSDEALYPILDQIVQSFEYKP